MAESGPGYRVSVFYGNAAERRTAEKILGTDLTYYNGVIDTRCTEEQLAALREADLLVDMRGRRGPGRPPAELVQHLHDRAGYVTLDADAPGLRLTADSGSFRESESNLYMVRIPAVLDRRRRNRLRRLHVTVAEFRPPDTYLLYLTPEQRTALDAEPWVADMRPWTLGESLTPGMVTQLTTDNEDATEYDVLLHRPGDLRWVRDTLAGTDGVEVLFAMDVMVRFRTECTGEDLRDLLGTVARLHEVRTVSPYHRPTLYVDHARKLTGLNVLRPRPGRRGFTGRGEVVAVFDSGVDHTHPDLAGRLVETEGLAGTDPFDEAGHGTHVTGIIVGTGKASRGRLAGCAPGAKAAVFRVTDESGRIEVPPCLGQILTRAVDAGAHIINLSWGNALAGPYDMYALSVDKFVYEHPDVLVVVAVGNDGQAPEGTHLFNTVGTPATAKNCLAVGACETDRHAFASVTWSNFRRSRFPLPPAGDEHVAGDPRLPAAISSRGPSDFGSVKPDLLAPGTYILAARTSSPRIDARLVWEACETYGGRYVYIGGTSMAAPVVTGAAAVLREYLRRALRVTMPSAALLKAVLVAAARRLPTVRDSGSWQDVGYPDFDQGYGRLDLSSILPHLRGPRGRRLVFDDVPNGDAAALEAFAPAGGPRRSSRSYTVSVAPGARDPLRVVLAWTDYPGSAVQNNLDLAVNSPNGSLVVGNAEHTFDRHPGFTRTTMQELAGARLDKLNNVEQIVVARPRPGKYRIRVIAQNTPFPPQGYAVCVAGQLSSGLVKARDAR